MKNSLVTMKILIICVSLLFVLFCIFSCDKTEQVLLDTTDSIPSSSSMTYNYDMTAPAMLDIDVTEATGSNIEFNVFQDGKSIYSSGVKKGNVNGLVKVVNGRVTLEVKNGNLFEGKVVRSKITRRPL